ncbi:MAG: PQQ-binding-like beta-propeller repeat protein [Acidobacteria bacterium]|nr:PQQ-binding-like beta-propeller repeat protein [Acidobacteriota bacterium]
MREFRSAMSRACSSLLACAALVVAADAPGRAQDESFVPVTDAMLQDPDPADWLMWRRTLDGWGYSPLDAITGENVGDLRLVWSRALHPGTQEGTPLAYDGVLYMPNPRDVIQAIDAVTGDLLWEHRREIPDDAEDYMFATATNRNIAIHGNLIIDTSADDHVFALDATTGEVAWETLILDYRVNPANQTSGPIIANGRVVSGRSCMPQGGPDACVITAHDATTGAELWRRRTIPAPGEPGDETWGGVPFEQRTHVGAWMVPSYDPALDLVYIGTSVTSPAPKFLLGGTDNTHLYHNSTLGDPLALPASERPLGPRSPVRAPAGRHRRGTGSGRGELDQSPAAAGRGAERRHRHSGQDGRGLYPRSGDRRVPVGDAHDHAERHQRHRRRHRNGAGERGARLHGHRPGGACLSDVARRQGLGGGCVQPVDQHDVLPAPQRLRADDGDARARG